MGVQIKGLTSEDFFEAVGADPVLMQKALQHAHVSLKNSTLTIVIDADDPAVILNFPIALSLLFDLKAGTLTATQKDGIAKYLNYVFSCILEGKVVEEKTISGTLALLYAQKGESSLTLPPVPEAKTTQVDVFPIDQMHTASLISLRKADRLYQPVHGTSTGSRYYVVGLFKGLAVAARFQNGALSIRVEGDEFKKLSSVITQLGLVPNFKGVDSYASLHCKATDNVMARQVVGAMLLGVGLALTTPFPDLKLIANK